VSGCWSVDMSGSNGYDLLIVACAITLQPVLSRLSKYIVCQLPICSGAQCPVKGSC